MLALLILTLLLLLLLLQRDVYLRRSEKSCSHICRKLIFHIGRLRVAGLTRLVCKNAVNSDRHHFFNKTVVKTQPRQ